MEALLRWRLAWLWALLFLFAWLCTAWVSEDAFITFRAVDQLLAGHGPVWNLGERVQVYTHPLWYGLLALGTGLGLQSYWVAQWLSLLCLLGQLALLLRLGRQRQLAPALFFGLSLLLTLSRAFMDYSSAGLENPLLHLLLLVYVSVYLSASPLARKYGWATLVYGLLFLTRPDGIILLTPLMLQLWLQMLRARQPWLKSTLLALLPVIGWELFSLIYYGSLVPNTALAKVNIDYPAAALHQQTLNYLAVSWDFDPLSLVLIAGALGAGLGLGLVRRQGLPLLLAAGLALQLAYLFRVGADYMVGRFLSAAVLLAVLLLLLLLRPAGPTPLRPRWLAVGGGLLALLLLLSPNYRPNPNYSNDYSPHSVNDQRGYGYPTRGLLAVWLKHRGQYAAPGLKLPTPTVMSCFVGLFPWGLPLEQRVIDPYALTEPFLARLPAKLNAKIGHYERALPPGFIRSRLSGENRLRDPVLAALYDDVELATRSSQLFSGKRWAAIWRLNTGHYRQLDQHFDRNHTEFAGTGIKLAPIPPDFMQPGTVCTPEPIPLF